MMDALGDVDDARVLQRLAARDRRRRARRRAAARAGRARRAPQHAHRLRGARVGLARQPLRAMRGRSSREADHPHLGLILDSFHILSLGDDAGGDRRHSRRQDLLPADGRCAAAVDGRAAMEPPLPQFPGPGPARPAALPRAGAASPATPARCRSRSSTTCSARRRTGARRGRCDAVVAVPRGADAPAPRESARPTARAARTSARDRASRRALRSAGRADADRRRVPRVRRRRGDRVAARQRARDARLPARRPASLEERDAVPAGLDQPHPQCRAGFVRARAFQRARPVDLRGEPDDRRRGRARETAPPRCTVRASTAGSAPTSRTCRRCARRTAASSISSPTELASGALYEIDFDLDDRRTGERERCRARSHRPRRDGRAGRRARHLDRCSTARCSASSRAKASSSPTRSGWCAACGVASADRAVRVVLNVSQSRAHAHGARDLDAGRVERAPYRVRDRRHLRDDGAAARATARSSCRSPPTTTTTCVARFDLAGRQVERMRDVGVLFDRTPPANTSTRTARASPTASSSRSCSASANYDGYGALNAPARMASQSQSPASS